MKETTASGTHWRQFDLKRRKLPRRPRMELWFLPSLLLPVGAALVPVLAAREAAAHVAVEHAVAELPLAKLQKGSNRLKS